ncbi:MAG: hypothetical protein J6035_02995 [Bacteroidaceae bacterium]|nr:hypothetical protein [Bacteroidaceae bacterium]
MRKPTIGAICFTGSFVWWYWGGSEDIDVSRCILWPDVAHPVNIGFHGDGRLSPVSDIERQQ